MKNNSSSSYKNPFFSSLRLGLTQLEEAPHMGAALDLANVKNKSSS